MAPFRPKGPGRKQQEVVAGGPDTVLIERNEVQHSRPDWSEAGAVAPLPPHESDETEVGLDHVAASGRVAAILLGEEGPLRDRIFAIPLGTTDLGRETTPRTFPDTTATKGISRIHATIEVHAGFCELTRRSDKKTILNGEELAIGVPTLLQHGDRIQLGTKTEKAGFFVLLMVPPKLPSP